MIRKSDGSTKIKKCAFCGSAKLTKIIDFGDVALAGGFLKKKDFNNEQKYPLDLMFCENCYAVQVGHHIDPKILFENDYYFSSSMGTLRTHFANYAAEVVERFIASPKDATTVEIGCNDGVLLRPIADQGVGNTIGVDPAKNIVETVQDERLTLINDFFGLPVANSIVEKYGRADLIMANNVFAHISDINGITEGVKAALADDGVFIFEVHYLGKIIQELQYDFIYHEHIYYYSLLALQNHLARHGMVIFDLKPIPIHGGSIRYYAAKKDSKHAQSISSRVKELESQEKAFGYDKPEAYRKFAANVEAKKDKLMKLLETLRKKGRTVIGYGASGRANTIIQYCGITDKHVAYMIDDGPAKQGMYTPGSHLRITDNSALKTDKPDYVLLFAWSFYDEIIAKCAEYLDDKGRVIVPLPDVRITISPNDEKIL